MIVVAVLIGAVAVQADVLWSRFKGQVKGVNGKTSLLTIQNKEGDLLTVKIDSDVLVMKGKDEIKLKDVSIDDQVTLLYLPRAPVDSDEPAEGGVYKSAR